MAVFLDRDGVLNKAIIKHGKPYSPCSIIELVIFEDALKALTFLKEKGFMLIVVTNQPDVARGTIRQEVVTEINSILMKELPLDEIRICFHDDIDNCMCRKPNPGLLLQAAKQHHIDLAASVMIGDRWKDIVAGQQAGCRTILIDHNYEEQKLVDSPNFIAKSLTEAANWIEMNLT